MKSFRKELWFNIPTRLGFVNITRQVETCLQESGIMEGLSQISAMHITASVFVNDDESGLHQDYEHWLEELAPMNQQVNTSTTKPVKIMRMHISNAKLWVMK